MGRSPWATRLTVEDCPVHLSAAACCYEGVFEYPIGHTFVGTFPLSDGSTGRLRIEMRADGHGRKTLFVCQQGLNFGGRLLMGAGQEIPFTTTRPHFGGARFWFVCECSRRVARIYLPTSETLFRCRICYDLTYQSSREHSTRAAKDRAPAWGEETPCASQKDT
jgi:hypothetical protein